MQEINANSQIINIDVHESNGKLVTSSRNVAEAFGKRHDHVIRDIKAILETGEDDFTAPNFGVSEYIDPTGRKLPEYLLTRDGCMLLIMGYTGEKALKIKTAYIKRFNEMEATLKSKAIMMPNFSNPAEAARAWANEYEAKQLALKERDEAIKTKAWIGSKREATAMATASKYLRENERLKEQIGDSKNYKQVRAISWLKDYFELSKVAYQQIGKKLNKLSKSLGYAVKEIEDSSYGTIKSYNVEVISAFKKALDSDLNMLRAYRV